MSRSSTLTRPSVPSQLATAQHRSKSNASQATFPGVASQPSKPNQTLTRPSNQNLWTHAINTHSNSCKALGPMLLDWWPCRNSCMEECRLRPSLWKSSGWCILTVIFMSVGKYAHCRCEDRRPYVLAIDVSLSNDHDLTCFAKHLLWASKAVAKFAAIVLKLR